ncbi:hypothetical protein K435DRAFT_767892 [Dendrothele bispora CBS 962.96]|uniref:RING-type domain-containing protein n=1 Tax=Dendrothele bispora (strain CBS 962.96) TaxID=1314807 RepID=A0A4S8KX92_DENBC|nr:hypothetical protein K435DRAFT_767892 [Dendrothele bispora CBS 962.96]
MPTDNIASQYQNLLPLPSGLTVPSYNISFNLSSFGSKLLDYPSRLLARMRRIDELVAASDATVAALTSLDEAAPVGGVGWTGTGTETLLHPSTALPKPVLHDVPAHFPGPWGFFTSGYMAGLFLMAVLMHRIENVVVPTRIPHPAGRPSRRSRNTSIQERIYRSFLPLNLNKTSTRLALHLPTLYFLCRMLVLWSLLILQTADLFPRIESGVMHDLGVWSQTREMKDVSWQTFCAVCAAFCVETFVKGLDGVGVGFGAHLQANTSPFNLVGYAFLLHVYASPITHVHKPEGLPSRPDKHVLITIAIPLLQITFFHILSVRKRWSNHRFIPTALASFLSLLHFHVTILAYSSLFSSLGFLSTISTAETPRVSDFMMSSTEYTSASSLFDAVTTTIASLGADSAKNASIARPYSSPTGTSSYPILNYIPNIFETLLLLTIFLTIALNALTQLLLTGEVSRPLLGLGIGGQSGSGWSIPWDEDFGVVLLRVGTASLEATGLRGWGNEVTGVVASIPLPSSTPEESSVLVEYGRLKMDRSGVVDVLPGSVTTVGRGKGKGKNTGVGFGNKGKKRVLKGWNNEVRDVDLGRDTSNSRSYGLPGVLTVNRRWFKEMWKFCKTVIGVSWGSLLAIWDTLRCKKRSRSLANSNADEAGSNSPSESRNLDEDDDEMEGLSSSDDLLYDRFRSGQVSDDEDEGEEWIEQSEEELGSDLDELEDEDDDHDEDEDGEERDMETIGLYSDLQMRESTPGATSSRLLAHMAYSGGTPLTRGRYGSLLSGTSSSSTTSSFVTVPRPQNVRADSAFSRDDGRRNCVICTVEARQIICWPCRCLSMCDECRESLAARSSASKHRCPCCRRTVEGYSRIFIP